MPLTITAGDAGDDRYDTAWPGTLAGREVENDLVVIREMRGR
jgi:hypothetical protein